jgi:hypothetical protein
MDFELYQVLHEHIATTAFRPFDRIVETARYHRTYKGELKARPPAVPEVIDDVDALNRLYHTFNVAHPIDFESYSLSVGDIVVLDGTRHYFCNTIGWHELKPEQIKGQFGRGE